MKHRRPVLVFGPAYLDRVVRVDAPLRDPALKLPPLDRSVYALGQTLEPTGQNLLVADSTGAALGIALPAQGHNLAAWIRVGQSLPGIEGRGVRALAVTEDLGGMGAGFAALLGGTLVSALGSATDATSHLIGELLDRNRITHRSVRIEGYEADWTLLISSGEHGDKLAIGFRGCHAAWVDLPPETGEPARVRVVAALPNRLAASALGEGGGGIVRAFFPNARAMLDRTDPADGFAERVDLLSCNRGEWRDLGDRAGAFDRVPVVAITDGPAGATVRFVGQDGDAQTIHVPAFPRLGPIRDTNRAGEAFAGTLLATLVEAGWTSGPIDEALIRHAAERASAASALVLGRAGFGFATPDEVDDALRLGAAPSPDL